MSAQLLVLVGRPTPHYLHFSIGAPTVLSGWAAFLALSYCTSLSSYPIQVLYSYTGLALFPDNFLTLNEYFYHCSWYRCVEWV